MVTSGDTDAGERDGPRRPRLVGASIGVLSGAIAIGVGQLLSGVVGGASSPIIAVGSSSIDATPEWLKHFAIRTFGANDKRVLLSGIGLVLLVAAVVLGVVSMRRPRAGVIGLLALGGIGTLAAVTRPGATLVDALPAIVGTAAGIAAFLWLRRAAGHVEAEPAMDRPVADTPTSFDRRRFLYGSAVVAGLAATTGFLGEYLVRRSDASASRAAVRLPGVADAAPATPVGADLGIPGVSPFITPNEDFYRVDTALLVPSVTTEEWSLSIHGMVDRPLTIDYAQLVARPLIERDVTLTCVSNEVGDRYLGTARWTGVRLTDLLDEAGIHAGVTQIVSRSIDGFTTGTPASVAIDGRDAMLAIAMNGEALPLEHGFPVRMVIPGLYGYESACKWITDIELTTYEAYSAYWVRRGWAEQVLIKTGSRIDAPRRNATLSAGNVPIAGIAWAQHRGIERVEVQIDQGEWTEARLGDAGLCRHLASVGVRLGGNAGHPHA